MKKFIVLVLAIIIIFLIYRGMGKGTRNEVIEPVTVALAEQNGSDEAGQAVLTEVDGQVAVAINLTGAPAGIPQPAHIHRGSCVALGEPIYTLSQVADGASETTITASFEALKLGLPLAINVHKSVAESATYVACGDIEL